MEVANMKTQKVAIHGNIQVKSNTQRLYAGKVVSDVINIRSISICWGKTKQRKYYGKTRHLWDAPLAESWDDC